MPNLSDLFIGNPKWNRPTHGTNRCVILAGTSCCICVPSNATRVVVEMWAQGGGGSGNCCCQWSRTGGSGGDYAYKVWTGSCAPCASNCCMMLCGCVCACDCMGCQSTGHPGQISWIRNCSTGNPIVGSYYGQVNGGTGGQSLCTATTWPCIGCCTNCNAGYDICCISASSGNIEYYSIAACMSFAQSSGCRGGSMCCCQGAACYCAGNLCSFTCSGQQHIFNDICPTNSGAGGEYLTFDQIFQPIGCGCFDVYRRGACGWSKNATVGLTGCTIWNYCWIGVGGAAYAGGAQENRSFSNGTYAYCGYGGNMPGGGAKGSGACGGGCCIGGIGGAGVILVSWST